jgi:hypothetical protein
MPEMKQKNDSSKSRHGSFERSGRSGEYAVKILADKEDQRKHD